MSSSHTSFFLIAIIIIAIFGFGGAHYPVYVIVSLLLSLLLPYCAYEFSYRPSRNILILSTLFLILPLFLFISRDISTHQSYFPSVYEHLQLSFSLTETSKYPLLIRPYGAMKGLIYIHIYLLGFLTGTIYFKRSYRIRNFSYQLCHVGAFFCLFGYIQRFFDAPTIYWISTIPSFMREPFFSTYSNPSHAGYFLAFLMPIVLSLSKRVAIPYGVLFSGTIFYTGSRGAILALGVGTILYSLLRYHSLFFKYVVSGLIFLTATFLLYVNYEYSGSFETFSAGRFNIWAIGIQILKNASWMAIFGGHGGNSFVDLYTINKTSTIFATTYRCHQGLLEWIIEHGLIHFLITLFLIISSLYNIFLQYKNHTPRKAKYKLSLFCASIALLVSIFLDISFHIPSLGFLCFLSLGCGYAKSGTAQVKSFIYVLPFSFLTFLTALTFLFIEKGNSNFASHSYIQEQAEKSYNKGDFDKSSSQLLQAIKTAPLRARPLRIYNQIPQQFFGVYTSDVISRAPNDTYSYISAARISMKQGDLMRSWNFWHQALSLQVSNNNSSKELVHEALEQNPQLAIFYAIPIEKNDRLQNAINYMIKREFITESLQFMEEFYDLTPEFQNTYTKLLFIDGQCKKAWKYHITANDCSFSKLEAKIASCLQSDSSKYHRKAIGLCGQDKGLKYEYLKAQLREGLASSISQALVILKKNPRDNKLRRLLIHCMIVNKETQYAQVHLRYLINNGVATKEEKKDLTFLRNRKPTQHYPLSFTKLQDPL